MHSAVGLTSFLLGSGVFAFAEEPGSRAASFPRLWKKSCSARRVGNCQHQMCTLMGPWELNDGARLFPVGVCRVCMCWRGGHQLCFLLWAVEILLQCSQRWGLPRTDVHPDGALQAQGLGSPLQGRPQIPPLHCWIASLQVPCQEPPVHLTCRSSAG